MPRGGYRPGAGRPRKAPKPDAIPARLKPGEPPKSAAPADAMVSVPETVKPPQTPLAYMLEVMNDQSVDTTRRDRMAIAAAPFLHPRMAEDGIGKRDREAEAAKQGATGKFQTPTAPRLVVSNE